MLGLVQVMETMQAGVGVVDVVCSTVMMHYTLRGVGGLALLRILNLIWSFDLLLACLLFQCLTAGDYTV